MTRSGPPRRSRRASLAPVFLAACFASAGVLGCADRDQRARAELTRHIDAEIERLAATAASIDRDALPESIAAALGSYLESLEAVRGDGAPELRLYELRDPFVGIETVAFYSRHSASVDSAESLEALGGPLEGALAIKTAAADGSVRSALIETAATRSRRLTSAGVRYGRIASPESGLYYLAQAAGNRQFHDFLAGLDDIGARQPVPDRVRLLAVATEIESEALDWLERDPTQRELIPVSVRLEEAREMLEAHQPAGAALLLLEARRELSLRSGVVPAETPDDAPPSGPAGSFRSLLAALGSRDEGAGEDDESAKIVRAELLPLYESMLVAPGGPDADPRRSVTLTLVRWPYT